MATGEFAGRILDNKYQLITLLGEGGMGVVYQAEHILIRKQVAVKFLHKNMASNKEAVKRFYREAQAAAAIGHDSIIDVMDVGVSKEGTPYLVMEYLEGKSLSDLISRNKPLSLSAVCGIMEPALLALHAAHSKGIVHRDLKPDNIFLTQQVGSIPKIKLIDFGISKISTETGEEKLTQTGSVMGTPAYMAPEQARGSSDLDHRADIYSMGVIMYEMLTGRLPFEGKNFTEIIVSILTDPPIPPTIACQTFPNSAESCLMKALEKNTTSRYQNALEFLDELKNLDGFTKRQDNLTLLASSASKTTFASGYLGKNLTTSNSENVAADILSQAIRANTPADWTGTASPKTGSNKVVLSIIAIASVISISALIVMLLLLSSEAQPILAGTKLLTKPSAQIPAQPESIAIEIKGIPPNGLIFYDDMLVTMNPYRVHFSQTSAKIKVEANGFEPFLISVIPSQNQVIEVTMKPKLNK